MSAASRSGVSRMLHVEPFRSVEGADRRPDEADDLGGAGAARILLGVVDRHAQTDAAGDGEGGPARRSPSCRQVRPPGSSGTPGRPCAREDRRVQDVEVDVQPPRSRRPMPRGRPPPGPEAPGAAATSSRSRTHTPASRSVPTLNRGPPVAVPRSQHGQRRSGPALRSGGGADRPAAGRSAPGAARAPRWPPRRPRRRPAASCPRGRRRMSPRPTPRRPPIDPSSVLQSPPWTSGNRPAPTAAATRSATASTIATSAGLVEQTRCRRRGRGSGAGRSRTVSWTRQPGNAAARPARAQRVRGERLVAPAARSRRTARRSARSPPQDSWSARASAAPVGRVRERGEQQRHVVVLGGLDDGEGEHDLRVEGRRGPARRTTARWRTRGGGCRRRWPPR